MRTENSLKERYKKVKEIVAKPFSGLCGHHLFGGEYTGLGDPIGLSSVDNTPNQANELAFALSLSQHPMIDRLISDPKIKNLVDEVYFNTNPQEIQSELDALANSLAQNRVLSGMRILDLGCGQRPAFAYCARKLGADKVYTVDIIPSDELWIGNKQKEARENHIQLDLRRTDAYDVLKERTGGNFDLVASASIHEQAAFADASGRAAPPWHLDDLALALAKDEGVYFNAEYLRDEEIRLKDPSINYEKRVRDAVSRA